MSGETDGSLQRALAALHVELGRSTRLDESSKSALRAALMEISSRLEGAGAAGAEPAAPHGLEAIAVSFEADHPALAAGLRRIIELLGQAGV